MNPPPSPAVAIVAMLHVADVERSARFYSELGFAVENTHRFPADGPITWMWLQSGPAALMLTSADEPVIPEQQAALFYVYVKDVSAMHAHLRAGGIHVGEITTPFFAPRGQFQMTDPDGYCLYVMHT